MSEQSIQLEMNFEGSAENHFKQRLDNGTFQILAEIQTPARDVSMEDAVRQYSGFEFAVLSKQTGVPASLAFIDQQPVGESMDMISFADAICQSSKDCHLLYLSGRDRQQQTIREEVGHAMAKGFKNFCAVSGATGTFETEKEVRKHLFQESINILEDLQKINPQGFLAGCVVNPYKYTPCDSYLQAYKLIKKINAGAAFAVTQYGWDMQKLQELRWFLMQRSIQIPAIARLMFLTPQDVEPLCAGRFPGIAVSPDFEKMLKTELEFSPAQFEAAQLRRLQLHAAGAKLLGYSGVQIAGIQRPDLLENILEKLEEAFREFPSFEEWRDACCDYYSRLELAPFPHRFYMFEGLFQTAYPDSDLRMKNANIPECSFPERTLHCLGRLLFNKADQFPAAERRLTKKLLMSCRSCESCRLPMTDYVCPERCPKGFANGACGNSKADGTCEFSRNECVFAKRMRLCSEFRDYSSLEEGVIRALTKRP